MIGTWDFGLISPLDPRFHASTEEHRAYHHGTGTHLYAPASDDPKLCRGGDYSCYRCSLCEAYVTPWSNDDGTLICPYCEATGLVVLNDEVLDKLEAEREFARNMGLGSQLEKQLDCLAGYARGDAEEARRQCVLVDDFAPHSFCFGHFVLPKFAANGKRSMWFNGGLIYQGPDSPADGSFPSLTVSLSSGTGWFCHT